MHHDLGYGDQMLGDGLPHRCEPERCAPPTYRHPDDALFFKHVELLVHAVSAGHIPVDIGLQASWILVDEYDYSSHMGLVEELQAQALRSVGLERHDNMRFGAPGRFRKPLSLLFRLLVLSGSFFLTGWSRCSLHQGLGSLCSRFPLTTSSCAGRP